MMLLEAGTAVSLLFVVEDAGQRGLAWAGLPLLAVIWLSTALVQGPTHGRLTPGFDERLCRKLVVSNWVRTFAWSGRSAIALLLLARF
jgi:hypothetical protein